MDVAHCFDAQSLGLLLCFDSIYPPFRQQFLVELLQMQRCQIIQRDLAELRLDVVFDVAMIGQVRLAGSSPWKTCWAVTAIPAMR